MHDHATGEDRAVDSAEHPWTLDNPAHGWFGLSSACGSGSAAHRAVSVAEVVAPSRDTARMARELMVALVRAGVTATCGSGRTPATATSSRLQPARRPDRVGGPDDKASTAAVLDRGRPRLYRGTAPPTARVTGQVRLWVPAPGRGASVAAGRRLARRARAARADRRRARGRADWLAPSPPWSTTSTTRRSSSPRTPRRTSVSSSPRTVALINRGVPGFAVEPDHTLHSSLMRRAPAGRPARGSTRRNAAPPTGPTSSCSTGRTPSTSPWCPAKGIGGTAKYPRAVLNSTTRWCAWWPTGERAPPPTARCCASSPPVRCPRCAESRR